MNKIDEILQTVVTRMITLPLERDKHLSVAKSQLKQAILEGLPEKKEITHGVDMITIKNYNNTLNDVTQSIERLFEGKEGK